MEGEPEDQARKNAPRRKGPMSGAEFAVFFNDVYSVATDPDRAHLAPLDALEKHGIDVDLPPEVARTLMPLLRANRQVALENMRRQGGGLGWAECGACGACGVCAACGGLNIGAPGAAAAAIWAIMLSE